MCNKVIHAEFSSTDFFCPFQILEPTVKKEKPCCRRMYVIFDNLNVCKNCGTIHDAPVIYDYIDFYQNMFKIKKKSRYHRKYHIQNILNNITEETKNQISIENRNKIMNIFKLLDKFGNIAGRKRLINIKFII